MAQLSYHETIRVPVPERYRAIMGRPSVDVDVYHDATGGQWRQSATTQPFWCGLCCAWRPAGPYWSCPPTVACGRHVDTTTRPPHPPVTGDGDVLSCAGCGHQVSGLDDVAAVDWPDDPAGFVVWHVDCPAPAGWAPEL